MQDKGSILESFVNEAFDASLCWEVRAINSSDIYAYLIVCAYENFTLMHDKF